MKTSLKMEKFNKKYSKLNYDEFFNLIMDLDSRSNEEHLFRKTLNQKDFKDMLPERRVTIIELLSSFNSTETTTLRMVDELLKRLEEEPSV